MKEMVELTKSKDNFKQDTTQQNCDMAQCSKQRDDWSEACNPAVSRGIANDFIVHLYGIFYSTKDERNKLPLELVELHTQFIKI